jgi:hypothetical protein
MATPPTSPLYYSANAALIRRMVALEQSVSLRFGAVRAVLNDVSNNPADISGLLTDMGTNAIVEFEVASAVSEVAQTDFIKVNITDEQLLTINPQAGDVMRFVNKTLPGDTLSNEWYGIIQLNFGSAGPKFHLSPQESLKIVYSNNKWAVATGL